MAPDLTKADEERFAALRERLADVDRADPPTNRRFTEFGPIDPMLASSFDGSFASFEPADWIAERKFDGTRIILEKLDGEVRLYTRRHVERSATVRAVTTEADAGLPDGVVIDGEVTFLDDDGQSVFVPIHAEGDIEARDLETVFFAFDMLVDDGTWIDRELLMERKDRLAAVLPSSDTIRLVEPVTGAFQAYYDEVTDMGEEGVIMKRRESQYHPGTRSRHWRKVKAFIERDALAVGFTPGEGERADTFGALVMSDGDQYIGRVGSGFASADLHDLRESFEPIDERPYPTAEVGMPYTPIDPFVIAVKYQEVTDGHELRAPVFLRRRPNKPPADVEPIES